MLGPKAGHGLEAAMIGQLPRTATWRAPSLVPLPTIFPWPTYTTQAPTRGVGLRVAWRARAAFGDRMVNAIFKPWLNSFPSLLVFFFLSFFLLSSFA